MSALIQRTALKIIWGMFMRETNPFHHNSAHFVTKKCHGKTNWMNIFHQFMRKKNRISAILVRFSVQVSSIWKGILRLFMRRRSHSSAQLVINASPDHIWWIDILKQCTRGNFLSALFVILLIGSLVKTNLISTLMKDTKIPLQMRNYQILEKTTNSIASR